MCVCRCRCLGAVQLSARVRACTRACTQVSHCQSVIVSVSSALQLNLHDARALQSTRLYVHHGLSVCVCDKYAARVCTDVATAILWQVPIRYRGSSLALPQGTFDSPCLITCNVLLRVLVAQRRQHGEHGGGRHLLRDVGLLPEGLRQRSQPHRQRLCGQTERLCVNDMSY